MKILTGLAILSLAASASAQDIQIAPRLQPGDVFRLETSRTRESTPPTPQDSKVTAIVEAKVLAATREGIAIEWTSGSVSGNSPLAQDPLMIAASKAMAGVRPVIKLSPLGEMIGLANQDDVLVKLQAAAETIRRDIIASLPPSANRQGLEMLLTQVLSPANLIGSVIRDAQTYFGLHGADLTVGQFPTIGLKQPNPLGGDPLEAKLTIRLESATEDVAVIGTTTVYDAGALTQASRQALEKTGEKITDAEMAKFPPMLMSDDGRFIFDRRVGLMREVIVNRRFSAAGRSRLDRSEIRLVAAPTR